MQHQSNVVMSKGKILTSEVSAERKVVVEVQIHENIHESTLGPLPTERLSPILEFRCFNNDIAHTTTVAGMVVDFVVHLSLLVSTESETRSEDDFDGEGMSRNHFDVTLGTPLRLMWMKNLLQGFVTRKILDEDFDSVSLHLGFDGTRRCIVGRVGVL